jgi:putative spermidine/putrescine transport system substrate-binding protein
MDSKLRPRAIGPYLEVTNNWGMGYMGYRIKRRSLLMGLGALTLGVAMGSCRRGQQTGLKVEVLRNSVPSQLLKAFERTLTDGTPLHIESRAQLSDLFQQLQALQAAEEDETDSAVPALVQLSSLGDYWLQPAIQQGLIQPLDVADLPGWQRLEPRWQQLVQRDRQGNLSSAGDLWAAPYRWGSLMIAYRRDAFDRLGWQPQDWLDLWQPELARHFSLPDSPRNVIGLTLKMLGYSANEPDIGAIADLEPTLNTLHQQVRVYSSTDYLQPLITGDTWLAVGWSTDILPVLARNADLAGVIPQGGTLLFADLWVMPASSSADLDLAQRWIEFFWQPTLAQQISSLSYGASPQITSGDRTALPERLQADRLLLPPAADLENSEMLNPLPPEAIAQYQALWTRVRAGTA